MQRLTPYLFFLLACVGLAMIAFDADQSWQTEEVDLGGAVLIVAGTLIGAHVLRKLVVWLLSRRDNRQD